MDPLSAGAVALIGWLSGKIIDWTAEKALDAGANKLFQLIKSKLPQGKIVEVAALPPSQRDDILEAELVQEVEQVAAQDEEVRKAVEDLGNDFQQVTEKNPEGKQSFITYVQNCKGIIITGGSADLRGSTFNIN